MQVDLAVQRVEDRDDLVLLFCGQRICNGKFTHNFEVEVLLLTAVCERANCLVAPTKEVVQVARQDNVVVWCDGGTGLITGGLDTKQGYLAASHALPIHCHQQSAGGQRFGGRLFKT
ncbi:hypothetical protein D9M68_935500 [compost metagenome]